MFAPVINASDNIADDVAELLEEADHSGFSVRTTGSVD